MANCIICNKPAQLQFSLGEYSIVHACTEHVEQAKAQLTEKTLGELTPNELITYIEVYLENVEETDDHGTLNDAINDVLDTIQSWHKSSENHRLSLQEFIDRFSDEFEYIAIEKANGDAARLVNAQELIKQTAINYFDSLEIPSEHDLAACIEQEKERLEWVAYEQNEMK